MSLAGAAGGAADAIKDMIKQRELARRQAFEEQQQQVENTRAASALDLQRQQESRMAEAQRHELEANDAQREFQRATTIAEDAMPGDVVNDTTAALLRKNGLESQLQPGQPAQGAYQGDDEQGVPRYEVKPTFKLRGGIKYIEAKEGRDAEHSARMDEIRAQGRNEMALVNAQENARVRAARDLGNLTTTKDRAQAYKDADTAANDYLHVLAQGNAGILPNDIDPQAVRERYIDEYMGALTPTGTTDRTNRRTIVALRRLMPAPTRTGQMNGATLGLPPQKPVGGDAYEQYLRRQQNGR